MNLPIAAIGIVKSPLRVERCGGVDAYSEDVGVKFLFRTQPQQLFLDEAKYAVTHLQKKSKFGALLMSHEKWWHLCFHVWYTFKFQQTDDKGEWIPGSEKVLYWRIGWSRWDAGDCKYILGWVRQILGKKITIPFGTWYGPGLHWD